MKESGLLYQPRKSSRHPALYITDAAFADDSAHCYLIISQVLKHSFPLLNQQPIVQVSIETKAKRNACQLMSSNNQEIRTLSNNILKCVQDYKYLGSHIQNSEKDFNIKKGIAWTACNKMSKIWEGSLSRDFKIRIFRVVIEPILLYGSELVVHVF